MRYLPSSKAGSVAHFESETLADNVMLYIEGKPLKEEFDVTRTVS